MQRETSAIRSDRFGQSTEGFHGWILPGQGGAHLGEAALRALLGDWCAEQFQEVDLIE